MSKQKASDRPSDLELMLYADGELGEEEARRVAAHLAVDAESRAKVESLRQVGESVRTYLELEADDAENELPAFAGLWDRIERRIHANGAAEPAAAPAPRRAPVRGEAEGGLWAAVRRWFEGHRGHIITGAVSAGAVAALMLALGPRERVVERQVAGGGAVRGTPAVLQSQPPQVEDLDVYEGSGTILTIEAEGEGDSAAAVIWISDDEDSMEDPI